MSLEQLIEELTRIRDTQEAFPHADVNVANNDGTTRTACLVEVVGREIVLR